MDAAVPFLEIRALTKKFGGVVAVDGLNMHVHPGETVGLIGPNGAGKTTVFNLVSGIYRPTAGSIRLQGRELAGLPTHVIAKAGVARTFQNIRLFRHLTVLENVRTACHGEAGYSVLHAFLPTATRRQRDARLEHRARQLLEVVGLADRAKELAGSLPYGYQRRLEIARALALSPRLLLLDEPAAGMNPHEREDLAGLLGRVKHEFGLTVLLIEHHMDMVMELAHRIYVLNFGKLIAAGTPAEVQDNPEVVKAYLGDRGEMD